MIAGSPSVTALRAAMHRAAHQVVEGGQIFHDPVAVRIVGDDVAMGDAAALLVQRPMRLFIAVRSRFAEDWFLDAVARGVAQIIVLGAGLDTAAYRGVLPDHVLVFEVDHPATQDWKRARLAETAIAVPENVRFVSVDFEHDSLGAPLAAAGFDAASPSFFVWLGVVPYLTETAIFATLRFVAGLPGGAEIVFDYSNLPQSLQAEARLAHDVRAGAVADMGEAWISFFETGVLGRRLGEMGFVGIDDVGAHAIAARYFPDTEPSTRGHGGHILHASTRRM